MVQFQSSIEIKFFCNLIALEIYERSVLFISVKKATNKIKDVFDDLNSHLSLSSSPLVSDLVLSSPSSPNMNDQRQLLSPSFEFPNQNITITDDEIKAGIIASMTLDQKLGLLQKKQRFNDRMR